MKKLNKLIVLVLAVVMITAAFAPAALAAWVDYDYFKIRGGPSTLISFASQSYEFPIFYPAAFDNATGTSMANAQWRVRGYGPFDDTITRLYDVYTELKNKGFPNTPNGQNAYYGGNGSWVMEMAYNVPNVPGSQRWKSSIASTNTANYVSVLGSLRY